MRHIRHIVIHHTESAGGAVDFIRYLHVDRNGWRDVGYHYIITNGKPNGTWKAGPDGQLQNGRPVGEIGAHARGFNTSSIGISLVGKLGDNPPTKKQIKTLFRLLVRLKKKHPDAEIVPHCKLNNTDCPGRYMKALLPILRMLVEIRK